MGRVVRGIVVLLAVATALKAESFHEKFSFNDENATGNRDKVANPEEFVSADSVARDCTKDFKQDSNDLTPIGRKFLLLACFLLFVLRVVCVLRACVHSLSFILAAHFSHPHGYCFRKFILGVYSFPFFRFVFAQSIVCYT